MLCTGNGRENLPPGCIEPEENEFEELFEPDPQCLYCVHYNDPFCTKDWNNMDESYCVPNRDWHQIDDCCEDYEWAGEELDEPKCPKKPVREDYDSPGKYMSAMRWYESDLRLYRKWVAHYGRSEE